MRRKEIAEVGTVKDVLQRRKHSHPDAGSIFRGHELTGVEQDEPGRDRQEGEEELPRDRDHERRHEEGRDGRLHHRSRTLYDAQAKYADDGQEQILGIVIAPVMCSQGTDGLGGVEG
nr:hypothetical protein CFP56_01458 [Quercus suber]